MPVKRFADEIEYLYHKGVDHFFIADDSMINDAEFVEILSEELITRGIKIYCKIACRADKITKRVVNALKADMDVTRYMLVLKAVPKKF